MHKRSDSQTIRNNQLILKLFNSVNGKKIIFDVSLPISLLLAKKPFLRLLLIDYQPSKHDIFSPAWRCMCLRESISEMGKSVTWVEVYLGYGHQLINLNDDDVVVDFRLSLSPPIMCYDDVREKSSIEAAAHEKGNGEETSPDFN